MTKPYSNAILKTLPEPTQRAIFALSNERHLPVDKIRQLLALPDDYYDADEDLCGFGVGDVGKTTIYEFLKHWRTINWHERLHTAAAVAKNIEGSLSDEDRSRMDQGMIDGVRELVLDSFTSGELDVDALTKLLDRILKAKALEHDERKLELLEKRAAQADAASGVVGDGKLTPEEKQKRLEGIFGFAG